MNCWYTVEDFPKSFFADPISMISYIENPKKSWICTLWNPDLFDKSIHDWLAGYNLKFNRALIFYRLKPEDQGAPHLDTEESEDGSRHFCTSGINIELSGRGSMNFFSGDPANATHLYTPTGQSYAYYPNVGKDDIIDTNDFLSGTCLVRTDVVHSVRCLTAPRMLLSFRFRNLDNTLLSWEETIERLKPSLVAR